MSDRESTEEADERPETPEPPDAERLEEVGGRIERAKDTARDVVGGEEMQFAESGTVGEELDDQTIAPPG